jgi:hypothetical protein
MQSSGEIGGQSIKQLKNKDCTSNETRVSQGDEIL